MNLCILMQSPGTDLSPQLFFLRDAHPDETKGMWSSSGSLEAGLGRAPTGGLPVEDQRAPSPPPLATTRAGRAGEKENKPSSFASRTQTPFYSRSACFLTLWKTSFISVWERLPIDNYALPSLYISLSLSLCLSSSPECLSTLRLGWTSQRKKKLMIYCLCFTRSARM